MEGHLTGFSLQAFLQVVEAEGKTCALRVTSGDRVGQLYFAQGRLVGAQAGSLAGLPAVHEVLRWPAPAIDVDETPASGLGQMDRPVAAVLLAQAVATDEQQLESSPGAGSENGVPLQSALDRLRDDVPEFVSTDVVSYESGLSIGGRSIDPDFDGSVAAASYAEVVKSNRVALELLGLGADSAEDVLITTDRVYILLRLLGESEYYHFMAITRRGNLGLARALMKKHAPTILRAVGGLT
jgi:predicted regulator of Ras-like GTPase activity (Roadblock/LC7/MglB family)